MKLGQKLACPLGDPVHNLRAIRDETNPRLLHLLWEDMTDAYMLWQIYVNGVLQKTVTVDGTDVWVSVEDEDSQNFIEIIAVGAMNGDEDCFHVLDNEHGNHALLKWRDSGNTKSYLVSWDDGDGSIDWATTIKTVTDTDTNEWYSYKSDPLISGAYLFGIRPRGFDGAIGPHSADIPVTITTFPLSVSGLTFHVYEADHMLSISWQKPADSSWDEGHVYWNGGNGEIDWEHMLVSGVTGITATIPYDFGHYEFGVRSQSNSNSLESTDWDKIIKFDMTSGFSVHPTLALAPYALRVSGMSLNYWKLDWRYNRREEDFLDLTKITHFDICGSGLTGIDWSYIITSITAGVTGGYGFCEQYYVSETEWPGGTYNFGVRPMTIDGFWGATAETKLFMSGTLGSMVTSITVMTSQ